MTTFPIIADKPVCMMPSTTTYFIYDQPINVTCHVASHPAATRIDWYWNSGNDIISLQPTSSVPETLTRRPLPGAPDWDRSWARLSVRPSKHQEDRQLSCWANNIMGRQEHPCRFFIRVASKWSIIVKFNVVLPYISTYPLKKLFMFELSTVVHIRIFLMLFMSD